jgi:hypothetical protein
VTILALAAGALAAQALPGPGTGTWDAIPIGGPADYAVDSAGIVRDGDRVRFRIRISPRTGAQAGQVILVRYFIDCRQRRMGFDVVDFYRPDGSFDRTIEAPPAEARGSPVGNDSGDVALLEAMCAPAAG